MLLKLKTKIWLTITAIVLLFSFFTLFYFPYQQTRLLLRNYNNEVQNLANTVALGVKIAITEQNFQGVQTAMEFVKDDNRLAFVSMVQTDTIWTNDSSSFTIKEEVFRTFPENFQYSSRLLSNDTIVLKKSPFNTKLMSGDIVIGFSTHAITNEKQRIKITALVVSSVVLIIGIILGFWLSKTISGPVMELRDAAMRVGEGDFTQKVKRRSGDEIGDLATAFNKMVENLSNTTNKLQEANRSLEQANSDLNKTLEELKNTQAQLVQSEKMASLGELTAGIAHEIQNPLNFVNNFAEISGELAAEMLEALQNKDDEAAIALEKNIQDNLQKITYHGKRADSIVKNMLMHSRANLGKKEPTDVNALVEEYVRLSYHGYRAQDKSFNARIETQLDERIGKANVIPQDLGRVLLNLFNNAFYAVNEKRKKLERQGQKDYEPTVHISTKLEVDAANHPIQLKVEVGDNGPGISNTNKEKIFQPFFTTKPTGQGTGLGLSLSYDIVKAQGGHLTLETKSAKPVPFIGENTGKDMNTVFTICLPLQ